MTYIDAVQREKCPSCLNATFWGSAGVCRRPAAGFHRLRNLADPFLPSVTAKDYCGEHESLATVKEAARQAAWLASYLAGKARGAE